jgi:hypothetical protein
MDSLGRLEQQLPASSYNASSLLQAARHAPCSKAHTMMVIGHHVVGGCLVAHSPEQTAAPRLIRQQKRLKCSPDGSISTWDLKLTDDLPGAAVIHVLCGKDSRCSATTYQSNCNSQQAADTPCSPDVGCNQHHNAKVEQPLMP